MNVARNILKKLGRKPSLKSLERGFTLANS